MTYCRVLRMKPELSKCIFSRSTQRRGEEESFVGAKTNTFLNCI